MPIFPAVASLICLDFPLSSAQTVCHACEMAVVWSRNIEGKLYEVRTAGATLRLYRNGVHHSQWNPNRPLAGCVWDLLVLPALYRPAGAIQDVLILGFGAGAAGRLLRELVAVKRIVGVEMDEIHLTIADGFFACSEGYDLVAGDAVEWVREGAEGGCFDFVLDDLYDEEDGMPIHCAALDVDWCRQLASLVREGGMLVFNTIEPRKLPHLPPMKDADLRKRFSHVRVFHLGGYENRVVVFSEFPLKDDLYEAQLRRICREYPACYGVGKRYLIDAVRNGR